MVGIVKESTETTIRTMSRQNPLLGVLRIHGELLKPAIDIGETSVSKYLRAAARPLRTRRTFLDKHEDLEL